MKASPLNPQPGDLLKETVDAGSGRVGVHWIVSDFLPWGFDGKHAWVLQSPEDGRKKIILKSHLSYMTRVSE